eukprot:10733689-Alexandrium_andersonii.AAC.1
MSRRRLGGRRPKRRRRHARPPGRAAPTVHLAEPMGPDGAGSTPTGEGAQLTRATPQDGTMEEHAI